MKKLFGLTSDYLAELARNCLKEKPEILPCDIFKSQSELVVNKGFIINSQLSKLPGSHFLSVLKRKKLYISTV